MPDDLPPELGIVDERSAARVHDLASSMRDRRDTWAALVGAGLSAGAGAPDWTSILREAGDAFGLPVDTIADDNYPLVAQDCLERAPSPAAFWQLIEQRLCGELVPTTAHRLVMSLPFSLFMTTNFDCLLDEPHQAVNAEAPRIISYPDLAARHAGNGRLAYLHGHCQCGADPGQRVDPLRLVFTSAGYASAYDHDSLPLPRFIQEVFTTMRVLLVGFSLTDFPIRKLLDGVRQAAQFASWMGHEVIRPPHYAIIATEAGSALVSDYSFRGLTYNVEPIYYSNADGRHTAVPAILDWLADVTRGAGPSVGIGGVP